MMYLGKVLFTVVLNLLVLGGYAQKNSAKQNFVVEIPEVALLGLVSDGSIGDEPGIISANEAGNTIALKRKEQINSVWINYSSVKRSSTHLRKITAYIAGEIPSGVNLKVTASRAMPGGKGQLGNSMGAKILTGQPIEIINNIGSAYTGSGLKQGHNLLYSLDVNNDDLDYMALKQEDVTFNVVYTLTD